MRETRFTGEDPEGLDARVRGSIRYVLDVTLPGMLHAALVRSPVPAGRVASVATERAMAVPGVVRVVLPGDLRALRLADERFGTMLPDQPMLAGDHVRHAGEPIAAILAETEAAAHVGAAIVTAVVDAHPAVFEADAALGPGAPLVHGEKPGNVLGRWGFVHGDLAAARRASVRTFEATYTSPAAQHVTFEPQVCVARWDGDAVELWAATQSPSRVAAEIARVFGLDAAAVRLHVPPLGGGYGGKNHAKLEPIVAALARLAGRPVRLANRRAEEFVTTTKHPATVTVESGIDGDGRFTFRRASIRWSAGAYAHSSPAVMRAGALAVCGPYRIPAAGVESVMAYTNLPPSGSFRGLGANQTTWAGESQVDEIARALGEDPVTFRRRNVVRSGDRLATGERVADAHWLECLDEVTRSLGDGGTEGAGGAGRRSEAVGVALAMKHTMTPSKSLAVVAALPDGTVEVRSSLVDMGQGLRTVLAVAAARELDVPAAAIRIVDPDTTVTPFDATTSSSRGAWAGTVAVEAAARDLRRQLEAAGAAAIEAPPEAVRLAAGRLVRAEVTGPAAETGLVVGDLVMASGAPELAGSGEAHNQAPVDPETGQAASVSHWHQGAVAVRVAIDEATGVVSVDEAHGAAWAGRVIDAGRARLQNEGGVVFGLGPALWEELLFERGLPGADSLWTYRIPSLPDVPTTLATVALEDPSGEADPTGLGESVIPAVAPAIGAAVVAATGTRIRDLPLNPERVLRALTATDSWPAPSSSEAVEGRAATPTAPGGSTPVDVTFHLDGREMTVTADPLVPLATILADDLGRRSVRRPCGVGVCGACTVLVDGRAIRSCLRPVVLAAGADIRTAEGLGPDDPIVAAFVAAGAAQCGSCIPGAVLAASDLLATSDALDEAAVRAGLAGNLCRCGTYGRIVEAVLAAAGARAEEQAG